ncbi:nucleotidyltransferase domain-containing protein [uncultured Clostridium sp.]|uniref:nucleotidyltransferase domain-containing protein n=1 Tax=uncultured Clostridium sp. TaxID=59620 RepID=UPI0028EB4D79|nr:nucleotidyltransferase domain-containing protein [uncultured Clostridium sp.]
MEKIKNLIEDFSKRPEIESIALGGSRATKLNDNNSDYDLYVYLNSDLSKEIRRNILDKYCNYIELNNNYWEAEDDCYLNDGTIIEIIYRSVDEFENELKSVVLDWNAHNGYTTCMWSNINQCVVLYDRNNKLKELKDKYNIKYPEELRKNIIEKNLKLLDGYIPSFSMQIEKALVREDIVSINHRITEFLASYFDIIFAVNELPHPGEKRLISICLSSCKYLPKDFEGDLDKLLSGNRNKEVVMEVVKNIIANIKELILNIK